MTLTTPEIASWIGAFMWPFMRVGALMISAPVFSNIMMPVRIRVFLGVALTVAVLPAVGSVPQVDPLSLQALLIGVQQILAGLAMGLLMAIALQTVVVAGESISLSMGLGFATMVDPQTGVAVPVLSQFLLIMATLLFLAMGGHLMLIQLLAESFTLIPIDSTGISPQDLYTVAAWGAEMYAGAVLIALPAVAVLLTVNMIIGVMTRAAPQLNIFSVGFPITMTVGFVTVLMVVLPSLPERMSAVWRLAFETIRRILGA